jgi:hypothetical protein
MGFRDYATYQAYQNQQRIMREGPAVVGVGTQGSRSTRSSQPPMPAGKLAATSSMGTRRRSSIMLTDKGDFRRDP